MDGLALHGFLTTPQLIRWTGLRVSDDAMRKRLERMLAEGLVEPRTVKIGRDRALTCWVLSEPASNRHGEGLSYVSAIGPTTARHHLTVAQVAIDLHLQGYGVTTERQLRLQDRTRTVGSGYVLRGPEHNRRAVKVMRDGRPVRYDDKSDVRKWYAEWQPEHRPDIRTREALASAPLPHRRPTGGTAWEIELSAKTTSRLAKKLDWYRKSPHYISVVYLCGDPSIAKSVDRVAKDVAPELSLTIQVLQPAYLQACISRHTTGV